MNNVAAPIQFTNPVVQLLEQLLADARANRIASLGVVAVNTQGGVAPLYAGPHRCELYTAAAMLQQRILHDLTQTRSPIIRATPA
jgi:hypothetical protein